ncbi:MAG TPA: hypothetical protein VF574_07635 [Allosphingosinicella sp.]|jgi:hypothetical protein
MSRTGARISIASWVAAAALAATAAAGPAAARPVQATITSADDLRTLHLVADCLASRYERSVRKLLAMDFRGPAYDDALRTLTRMGASCTPFAFGRLRSARVLVVGAFAEELLPEALDGARLADRVAYDPSKPALAARDDGEYLGLCAVRQMPDEVAGLLATKPASDEERLAMGKIRPNLASCVRAGAAARVNLAGLRALLALAAYRIVSQAGAAE